MDTRLYTYETLYCEGLFKPEYRGKIHLLSLFVFPYALYKLYCAGNGFTYPFFIGSVSLLTNFCCFGTSSLYHIYNWPLETEILLQKLDHFMISLWCFGMMFPIAFLLFPKIHGRFMIGLTFIAFLVNSYYIYISEPSIILSSIVPSIILLFVDVCYNYMNTWEWVSMWCVFAFQGLGTLIFSLKINPMFFNPEIFGYHELFHLLSLFAAFFVYQVNYSIVSRYKIESQQIIFSNENVINENIDYKTLKRGEKSRKKIRKKCNKKQ